ncbi:MAG: hypothetical protein AVDCRST_MAG02-1314 [uncultured Rubrobacteraceae bacterium]|uniref:Uncharacterized protein n=1 Tax=uncultured Rubrobacteraceae bacterium TaxID=349277 RepID=A0A6J4QSR0_9ACTN|nr:MAG: hypothetical protein AVDCRST_MAG02-1314 [uncultured Rubrobacteraceae bacterium]
MVASDVFRIGLTHTGGGEHAFGLTGRSFPLGRRPRRRRR